MVNTLVVKAGISVPVSDEALCSLESLIDCEMVIIYLKISL